MLAEQGQLLPAYEVLQHALAVTGHDASTLGDHWWYVMGRIAEQLALYELAREHYARVEKPDDNLPMATWNLVERRFAAMDEAAPR